MWNNAKGALDIIVLIFSMIAVVGLAYVASKWLSRRFAPQGMGRGVKIIDRTFLSQDKSLLIIKVIDRYMLISVTSQSIQKLCDIEATEVQNYINTPREEAPSFAAILQDSLKGAMSKYGVKKGQEGEDGKHNQ